MNRTIAAHKAVATMNKNRATQWQGVASHLRDENAALRRQLAAYKANSTRRRNQGE